MVSELCPGSADRPSGASEWTIAQVLSHLGSGAEIGLAVLEAALDGHAASGWRVQPGVWDRWNAMDAVEQAEIVRQGQRGARLPLREPGRAGQGRPADRPGVPSRSRSTVATVAGFRLNEFTLHTWDVAVALDPAAVLAPDAVELLLDVAPYMFGWLGRPGAVLDGQARSRSQSRSPILQELSAW